MCTNTSNLLRFRAQRTRNFNILKDYFKPTENIRQNTKEGARNALSSAPLVEAR